MRSGLSEKYLFMSESSSQLQRTQQIIYPKPNTILQSKLLTTGQRSCETPQMILRATNICKELKVRALSHNKKTLNWKSHKLSSVLAQVNSRNNERKKTQTGVWWRFAAAVPN